MNKKSVRVRRSVGIERQKKPMRQAANKFTIMNKKNSPSASKAAKKRPKYISPALEEEELAIKYVLEKAPGEESTNFRN